MLAFQATGPAGYGIHLVRPDGSGFHTSDGSGLARLTDVASSGGTAIHPAFMPDGSRVSFVLTDASSGAFDGMATVGLDGTGLAPATTSGFMAGIHRRPRPTP